MHLLKGILHVINKYSSKKTQKSEIKGLKLVFNAKQEDLVHLANSGMLIPSQHCRDEHRRSTAPSPPSPTHWVCTC